MKFATIAITFALLIVNVTALRMEDVHAEIEEIEYEPVEVEDLEEDESENVQACWWRGGKLHCRKR